MSELAHVAGAFAPGRTIEHNGRTFTFAAALDNATLLALESRQYDRARQGLAALRADYPEAEYVRRLDALREKYESGHYSMASEATQAFLQTQKGAVLLLQSMCDADEGDIFELLTHRVDDVRAILDEVLAATFPSKKAGAAAPKAKARR